MNIHIHHNKLTITNNHSSLSLTTDYSAPHQIHSSHGIYGLIIYRDTQTLVSIRDRRHAGCYGPHDVWEITALDFIPVKGKFSVRGQTDLRGLYYSRAALADSEFIFNAQLIENFMQITSTTEFTVNAICGFFYAQHTPSCTYTLVSRRSHRFSGSRYNRRGSDPKGYCANAVETSIIIKTKNRECSYTVLRESIPLRWSQQPDLLLAPSIRVHKSQSNETVERNYQRLRERYGEVVYLNLICDEGGESEILKEFEKRVGDKNYEYFNLSKEKSREKFKKKMEKWVGRIGFQLIEGEELIGDNDSKIQKNLIEENLILELRQKGIIRVNCIDCLDRTNVAQYWITESVLHRIMEYLDIPVSPELLNTHRKAWILNGDALSYQYSGTPALKSDIIRSEESGIFLKLRERSISLLRHLKSLWGCGRLQNSHDVLTGNCRFMRRNRNIGWIFMLGIILIILISRWWIVAGVILIIFEKIFEKLFGTSILDAPEFSLQIS